MWLAGANSACGERLTVTPCDFEGLPSVAPDLFLLVDNPEDAIPGQVGSVSDVTIVRLVGDLWMYSSVSAADATEPQFQTVQFHIGVYIADTPFNEVATVLDPTLSAHAASKDWMYRNLEVHTYAAGLGPTQQNRSTPVSSGPTHPHLDIRVKRKVRKEEAILMSVKVLTDNPFPAGTNRLLTTAFLYADIRCLAALP